MKKSKFLKKSLATLLALMLVVAMIPVGAAAADDPTVYVDNQLATLSGTVYTVTAKSTEVTVTTVPQDGVTLVAVDKDQNEVALADSIKLTEKAKKNGDVYTLGLRAKVTQDGDDATTDKDYTLNITVETAAQSSDATIKSVSIDGMASYDITDTKIIVYMPFGKEFPTDLGTTTEEKFIPTSDDALSVVFAANVLTVTAQDGSVKKYDVELKNETGFASFTVPNQVGDSTISEAEATNTVAIKMPFGTDLTQKIIPTFTVGETVTKVTTVVDGEEIEVKSGVTALSFESAVAFKVYTNTNTTGVSVTATLTAADTNTEAALKNIQVDTSNPVEVTGTTVTVEMPKGYKFDKSVTVKVVASAGAKVSIPAQSGVSAINSANGTTADTLSGVVVSGKTFVIRVVSADTKTTVDYTVKLTAAAADEAQLKDFALKGKLNGENVSYSADWTGTKGVITLPYALTDTTILNNFLVYATVSTGASLSETITNGSTKYSDLSSKPAFGTAAEYKVTAQDGTVVTYTVVLKAETAKTGKTVSSATLVGTKKVSSITADNTYKVTVGTAKDTADKTVKTLKVDVPYTFANDTATYFSNLTLSDGAVAYLATPTKIVKLDMDAAGDQAATPIAVPTDAFNSTTNKLTTTNALSIYVVSEKNAVGATFADESALQAVATQYYLYGVNAKPESGAAITGIKSDVDKNVTASISGKTITVTVPNSYAKADAIQTFTLNFSKSKMAEVYVGTAKTTELKSDMGSEETTDATKFTAKDGQLAVATGDVAITSGADKEGKITVYAEDGKASTPYTVKLVVADPEAGASITALKVGKYNATISGKTINVTLPYGTKLNPLKLDITASKMATVIVGTDEYDADANYDLNNNLTIKVTSEDTKTTNVYTLKATVSAQFTDVKEGTWYYDYVMQAAAAGIVNGKGNGIFDPEGNVTRRDFALMTARMLNADTSSYTTSPFKDVNDNDYALGAIAYCYDKKIIGGYEDGTFRPDANISREEAAKIVCVALGLSEVKNPTETFKDDAKIQNWAKGYVYACKEAGIFGGDNGNFLPGNPITRAETAKVMVISMNK